MDLKRDLLAAADTHCEKAKISRARLATIVVNDGKFFTRLEEGGGFTAQTFEKFMAYFAQWDREHAEASPAPEAA